MTPNRDKMVRDNRKLSIQLELLANKAMAQTGLSAVQGDVLLYILRQETEGTSLTAIHRDLGYSMTTLSTMLKRLREKGYVCVEPWEGDDRRKRLFPTDKGRAVRTVLARSIRQAQDQLYAGLSREELALFGRMQETMLANLAPPETQTHKEA